MLPWLGSSLRPFSARSLITTCLELVSFVLFWCMRGGVALDVMAKVDGLASHLQPAKVSSVPVR